MGFTACICYFYLGEELAVAFIWPILFGLLASPGVIKHAEHYDKGDILVVGSLPEVVKRGDWSLTKDRVNFVIHQRFDLIAIDIIVRPNFLNLDPTVFIYIWRELHAQISE